MRVTNRMGGSRGSLTNLKSVEHSPDLGRKVCGLLYGDLAVTRDGSRYVVVSEDIPQTLIPLNPYILNR